MMSVVIHRKGIMTFLLLFWQVGSLGGMLGGGEPEGCLSLLGGDFRLPALPLPRTPGVWREELAT